MNEKINIEVSAEEEHDVSKMADFIVSLNALKKKYEFKTEKFKKIYSSAGFLIDKINNYILEKNEK